MMEWSIYQKSLVLQTQENEILLMRGSYFKVLGQYHSCDELHMVRVGVNEEKINLTLTHNMVTQLLNTSSLRTVVIKFEHLS